ncbi:MAG: type II toxin-antitoxin system RelE/ParE family toxin [Clostridiales bacterium]|nr:type II toxin-antitoxin system RelE/ParE family toxin [Clostridiales bacterium]
MTEIFDEQWVKMGLNDDDLQLLQNYLLENPGCGDIIVGTGGLVKLRWKLPNKGKSGGIRVLYVDFVRQEKTILVNCYSKKQRDNISIRERSMYKELIKEIGKGLR